MGIFEPITLMWQGTDYIVPADKVLMLIAKIEDVVTMAELIGVNGAKHAKLAMGYTAALQFAGCNVSAEVVYKALFNEGDAARTLGIVNGLLAMMIPPEKLRDDSNAGKQESTSQSKD